MTEDHNPTARLRGLISSYLSESISTEAFCGAFEQLYNMQIDKSKLSPRERTVFRALFDKIVWYSPFPDEQQQIPNYIGEEEVHRAVQHAASELRISTPTR